MMIHTKKYTQTLAALLLFYSTTKHASDLIGISFVSPRSQSTNAARELVGWHPYINQCCNTHPYGSFTVQPSYGQSLRRKYLDQLMFSTETLFISGSLVENRGKNDILADYFGLSPSFISTVNLEPIIRTALVDFNYYIGWQDFYFRIHAPAVWTQWALNMQEQVIEEGPDTFFPAQYMAADAIPAPATSFTQAVENQFTYGQVKQPLEFGRFGRAHALSGLSDIQMQLGWNFIQRYRGHVGMGLRCAIPTGSRPTAKYLFEPVVGNGKHWEFGVNVSGRALIWEKDGNQDVSFLTEVNAMTLFKARQHRSFDFFDNGLGSRYILVKEFDAAGNYTGTSLPAINITTLECKISNNIQIDMAFMFAYTYHDKFIFDAGYEAWIRSAEQVHLEQCFAKNRYGFKGIEDVTDLSGNSVNTTQSSATWYGANLSQQAALADNPSPIFVRMQDLNLQSGVSPLSITHKFFAHLSYAWQEYADCIAMPFLGMGGEIEVEGINTRWTVRFDKNTISQWSLWFKGGIAY